MSKPLIVIAGPTAVGKSELSVRLAQKIGGSIICADSMQVYRGMDIGTAKLTKEEMQDIPHYLIDIYDPSEDFNIVSFKELAKKAIDSVYALGRIPIITGGTGFYIQSVVYDIDFTQADELSGYRSQLENLIETKGAEYVHDMLESVDPKAALMIHKNDHKRMIRALEYHRQTGEKISDHNAKSAGSTSCYNVCYFVLNDRRERIYDKINARVDRMIEDGLVDEVRSLMDKGLTKDAVSMHGIGYKEIMEYLEGDATLEEAIYNIKLASRHFAKRQLTWFKRERDVIWLDRDEIGDPLPVVIKELAKKGIINE